MGNVFRRITRKIVVQSVCTRVSEQLRPVQVGYVVTGGEEAAVYATRKFIINACPHDIMLRIDVQNAFYSLCRDNILEKSITTCLGICRFIHCAYLTPSALLISNKIIASSSSVQRGDPLGPLLSALTDNDIAHSVKTSPNIWYLDDIMIGVPSKSVMDSYPNIIADLSCIGLEVNTSKIEVISYCTESLKSVVHSLNDVEIVPLDHPKLLGSPLIVGAVRRILDNKTKKLKLAAERLMQLNSFKH